MNRARSAWSLAREQLDGDESIEVDFARQVHDAHAAAPDLAVERVTPGHRLLEGDERGVSDPSPPSPA